MVAAPWFARAVTGTPLLTTWFRFLGSKVGRGVWCETYWLPEADLVDLGDGATVNQGSVVQTHLFHDRMLNTDVVRLHRGATLGPNSVILPAATIGRHATVGPVSLVMRGESVPDKTIWIGNPIGPWVDPSDDSGPGPTVSLPTADPYLPGHGDPSFSVRHYDLDLTYSVARQPAGRRRHARGRGARAAAADRPRPGAPRGGQGPGHRRRGCATTAPAPSG